MIKYNNVNIYLMLNYLKLKKKKVYKRVPGSLHILIGDMCFNMWIGGTYELL